jgi:hypothetical protein
MSDLMKKIEAVKLDKNIPAPQEELREGETVVGILPDGLKKIFVFLDNLSEESQKEYRASRECIDSLIKKLSDSPSKMKPEEKSIMVNYTLAYRRCEFVSDLFWHGVKEEFPKTVLTPYNIGLRKGWKVVIATQRRDPWYELSSLLHPQA